MTEAAGGAPKPGVGGLTLEWGGANSAHTKLLDADGRNLFTVFPITNLRFDASIENLEPELTLRVRLDTFASAEPPLRARSVRMLVALDDLRALAAAHGYELAPVWPSDRDVLTDKGDRFGPNAVEQP